MPIPSIKAGPATNNGFGTSASLTIDAGVASGDLILQIICVTGPDTVTVPSGWTLIAGTTLTNPSIHAAYKISDGTEGGTAPPWTLSGSENWGINGWIIQDPDTVGGPIETTTLTNNAGSTGRHDFTAWTTDAGNGGLTFVSFAHSDGVNDIYRGLNDAFNIKTSTNSLRHSFGASGGGVLYSAWELTEPSQTIQDFSVQIDEAKPAAILGFTLSSDTLVPDPFLRSSDAFVEVAEDDTPALRVSDAFVEVAEDDTPALRVSDSFVEVLHTTAEAFLFNGFSAIIIGDDQAGPYLGTPLQDAAVNDPNTILLLDFTTSGNRTNDLSGTNTGLTVNGTPAAYDTGDLPAALSGDGSERFDGNWDIRQAAAPADWNFGSDQNDSPHTFDVWAKFDNSAASNRVFGAQDLDTAVEPGNIMFEYDGGLQMWRWNGSQWQFSSSGTDIGNNTWALLTFQWSGLGEGFVDFWEDGVWLGQIQPTHQAGHFQDPAGLGIIVGGSSQLALSRPLMNIAQIRVSKRELYTSGVNFTPGSLRNFLV